MRATSHALAATQLKTGRIAGRQLAAVHGARRYENDCIFDKFEHSISGDGKSIVTGTYHNHFQIYDRMGKMQVPFLCWSSLRRCWRQRCHLAFRVGRVYRFFAIIVGVRLRGAVVGCFLCFFCCVFRHSVVGWLACSKQAHLRVSKKDNAAFAKSSGRGGGFMGRKFSKKKEAKEAYKVTHCLLGWLPPSGTILP